MKRLLGLFILCSAMGSVPLWAKDQAPVTVQLDVVSTHPTLTVHLRLTNTSSHDVYLAKSRVGATGEAGNVFEVTTGGQKIRYTGALEQVKPQFPNDYIRLAPNASQEATVVISRYAFLSGEHSYTLTYSTDMWDHEAKHRFLLTSNPVTAAFKAK